MGIKHNEIIIAKANPFANCKLQREPYAQALTDIINAYPEGFVMAVNSKWGTGKTTFVKMWKQQLENGGYRTLYFNAWENDRLTDPTAAILGELRSLLSDDDENKINRVIKGAAVFSKGAPYAIIRGLVNKVMDTDPIVELAKKTKEVSEKILEQEVSEYKDKIKGLKCKSSAKSLPVKSV